MKQKELFFMTDGINVLYSGRLISTLFWVSSMTTAILLYQCPLQRTSHFYSAHPQAPKEESAVSMSFTADVSFLHAGHGGAGISSLVSMSFTADVSFLPSPSFFPLFMRPSKLTFPGIFLTISHMRNLIALFWT